MRLLGSRTPTCEPECYWWRTLEVADALAVGSARSAEDDAGVGRRVNDDAAVPLEADLLRVLYGLLFVD